MSLKDGCLIKNLKSLKYFFRNYRHVYIFWKVIKINTLSYEASFAEVDVIWYQYDVITKGKFAFFALFCNIFQKDKSLNNETYLKLMQKYTWITYAYIYLGYYFKKT